MGHYIAIDVGGTELKGAALDKAGRIIRKSSILAGSGKEAEAVFDILAGFIKELAADEEILGIGMAWPGPFDFENGISLMKGLGKYDSIYGMNITDELRKRTGFEGRIIYLHDIEAVAVGLDLDNRVMCLCIGTGAGSAFTAGKRTIKGTDGAPADGWIYNYPYKDSIIDDYLSARGLAAIAKRHYPGEKLDGRALSTLAVKGDKEALEVFKEFGEDITNAITPFLESFRAEVLFLGGQISGSFDYFGRSIKKYCKEKGITVVSNGHTSLIAFNGIYRRLKDNG